MELDHPPSRSEANVNVDTLKADEAHRGLKLNLDDSKSNISKRGQGNFDNLMFYVRSKKSRLLVLLVIAIFCTLLALTASLPSSKPYGEINSDINSGDTAWVLVASALVLLMTPGLALFYGGLVNQKNVISTMYQSIVSMGLITCLWVIIGFSLCFGEDANGSGILGTPATYYMFRNVGSAPEPKLAPTISLSLFSMFQLMFAMITPIVISGSLTERVNFSGWQLFICLWSLMVYCPLVHMVWHPQGILHQWGYIDFAGGLVVEMASGYGALAAAIYLGPRKTIETNHANIPFVILGTGLLWFGWLGFNDGCALSAGGLACQIFATTTVAGAAGMVMWILQDYLMERPASAVGACNGILVGLVAITPACGFVTVGGAMCIACMTCAVCYVAGKVFNEHTGVDDSLDVFTMHGVGGTCGVLLTAIFSSLEVNPSGSQGLIYGHGMTLGKHVAVVIVAIPFIMISTGACCAITNALIPLRVTEAEEEVGLDLALHGESVHGSSVHKTTTDIRNSQLTSSHTNLQEVLNPLAWSRK